MVQTQGEYIEETERIIMGDEKSPAFGYRPIDIRRRVEELLEIEKRMPLMEKIIKELRSR